MGGIAYFKWRRRWEIYSDEYILDRVWVMYSSATILRMNESTSIFI